MIPSVAKIAPPRAVPVDGNIMIQRFQECKLESDQVMSSRDIDSLRYHTDISNTSTSHPNLPNPNMYIPQTELENQLLFPLISHPIIIINK